MRFVRLWFVDVLGLLKSLAIPVSELESALAEGVGIDGSSLEGAARLRERDAIAYPGPGDLPAAALAAGLARRADVLRRPAARRRALPRRLAPRAAPRAATRPPSLGYTFQVGPEIEFFLFEDVADSGEPTPLDDGAYFDLTTYDGTQRLPPAGDRVPRADGDPGQGVPPRGVGVPARDRPAPHRRAVDGRRGHDVPHRASRRSRASSACTRRSCPSRASAWPGRGCTCTSRCSRATRNAFHDADALEPLSPLGRSFLAGVLAHAPELTAVTNQWVNSYKRLALGFEAPQQVDWARQGTDSLVRVPVQPARARDRGAHRAALAGPGLQPVPRVRAAARRRAAGHRARLPAASRDGAGRATQRLPQDLREAIDRFERSELARETLGDAICDWIVRNKRARVGRVPARPSPTTSGARCCGCSDAVRDAWIYTEDAELASALSRNARRARLQPAAGDAPTARWCRRPTGRAPAGARRRRGGPGRAGAVRAGRAPARARGPRRGAAGRRARARAPAGDADARRRRRAAGAAVRPGARWTRALARARRRVNGVEEDEVVRVGSLELNLATYQVTIDGEPVSLRLHGVRAAASSS